MRAVHRGKNLLVRQETASPEDLRLELGLKRQELKALRAPLERCGALVARPVTRREPDGEARTDSRNLFRWDQAYRGGP